MFTGNNFTAVGTPLSGSGSFGDGSTSQINPNNPLIGPSGGLAPYFSASAQGWEYTQNGNLEAWGVKTITAGTGATLVFATELGANFPGFSTAAWNVEVTMYAPTAGVTGVYAGGLSTTGFSINANGSGSTTVHWRVKGK